VVGKRNSRNFAYGVAGNAENGLHKGGALAKRE